MTANARYFQTVREARPAADWRAMLTQAAFCLALALVAGRCMVLETVRDPFDVRVGGYPPVLGTGADASLALDLLCCVPALLVLARRCFDKTYTLRSSLSLVLLFPMCAWMALSERWSSDKFANVISSANFVAAMALLWATAQLVRSWSRLRIVAAVAYGLLLVFLVRGFYYKYVDMPTMLEQKAQLLKQGGIDPSSFSGAQFEKKISELMGFNSSANSFAGLVVLFMTIGLGVAIQRMKDKDDPGWSVAIGLSAPLAVWLLFYTHCKAALVMALLVGAIFAVLWYWRGPIARQSRRFFWIGFGCVLLAIAAAVGHGLYHHSLPTDSLNFRWRYWVGAMRMFRRYPLLGVGWDNFGPHYLRYRLPVASEEIRDPHDFLVRFLVELGLIGFILMAAWMSRLWWELTRPTAPPPPAEVPRPSNKAQWGPVLLVASIATLAIIINCIFSIDFSQNFNWILLELVNRLLYLCALLLGSMVVALRSLEVPQTDNRPAPWLLYGILAGVGVFLVHNLIEFSLFEPGPTCLFGVLMGAALGVRLPNPPVRSPKVPVWAITSLFVVCPLCAVFGYRVAYPVHVAESLAHDGDDQLRAAHYDAASGKYANASAILSWNADYAFRAGRALHLSLGAPSPLVDAADITRALGLQSRILYWYGEAIDEDPVFIDAYQLRGILWLQLNEPQKMMADFEMVMELNPNEVSLRLRYAHALAALNLLPEARQQFILALQYNDLLDKAEPKRLSLKQYADVQQEIASLPG